MSYPSILTTFTDPTASQTLNSPSHSSIETAQNTALEQLQTFVGTLSSTEGTLMYDIRAAASNGGGHVQTANKGGTGQTSYTKGDILVATSSSVLSKLAVSTDGLVLTADSNTSAGISWGVGGSTRIIYGTSSVVITGNTEQNLFGASIAGGILSSVNGVQFRAILPEVNIGGTDTHTYRLKYGVNTLATCVIRADAGDKTSIAGVLEGYILANQSSIAQIGYISANMGNGSIAGIRTFGLGQGTASINSASTISMVVTVQHQNTSAHFTKMSMFTVDKMN